MGKNNRHVEWAGCSNYKEKVEELQKAHEEFMKLVDNGFKLADVKVRHKRPRIQRQGFKTIITCFGPMRITIEEYNQHCNGFKTL